MTNVDDQTGCAVGMLNSNISNIKAAQGYRSQAIKSFQFCDRVEDPQPSAVGRRGPRVKDKTRMTRSLGVRQASTIRPHPTIRLLALTGTLMTRTRLSPPVGLFPSPRAPAHPRHGSPASRSGSPSRRHGSGGQDTGGGGGGQAATGLFLEKCGI